MKLSVDMKNRYIIPLFLCVLMVCSCGMFEEKPSNTNVTDVQKIVVLPDSVKMQLIKQDSLYSEVIAKIDSLTIAINESKDTIAHLKHDLEKLESPNEHWKFFSIVALLISVVCLYLIFKKSKTDRIEMKNVFDECLNGSTKAMNQKLNQLDSKIGNIDVGTTSKNSDIECRFKSIEKNIKYLLELVNKTSGYNLPASERSVNASEIMNPKGQSVASRIGYSKGNSNDMFFEILDSNQEGCIFVFDFKSQNKCEFDLLSLDKIKSNDRWKEVVDYSANCTVEEATSYTLESKGVCEKSSDGSAWKVTKKLKIKLVK